MKKKDYEKPTVEIVKLQNQYQILQTSATGGLNAPGNYQNGGDPFDSGIASSVLRVDPFDFNSDIIVVDPIIP